MRTAALLLTLPLALGAASCTSRIARPASVELRPADFARASERGSPPGEALAESAFDPLPLEQLGVAGADERPIDISTTPGPPPPPVRAVAPAEEGVLVDAKVGEINGRPIFASHFLDKHGARLGAERQRPQMNRAAWLELAARLIRQELENELQDELLQAEARASLRPEERRGLLATIERWREDVQRQAGGSATLADRRLQSERGLTMDEYLRDEEARLLIRHQLQRQIESRVRTSWKDEQLFYERNQEVFNPHPVARFRLIRVPSDRTADIGRVREALAGGEPFEQIASLPLNTNKPEEGGLVELPFAAEFADARFFGVDALNHAARSLRPGEWTGEPVVYGSSTAWLQLESIQRTSRPLSDAAVQYEIRRTIQQEQRVREAERYMGRLKDRASFTDPDEMTRRLLQIAADRYWPEEEPR